MSFHQSSWALLRSANVEGADYGVDTSGRNGCAAVFVPVVSKAFRRWVGAGLVLVGWRRAMDGDKVDEVIRGGGGSAEVKDAKMRIRRHGRQN